MFHLLRLLNSGDFTLRNEYSHGLTNLLPDNSGIYYIFGTGARNIWQVVKRYSFAREFPGIHYHRLRHTFAVNKLLSQTAGLQMVNYQLGHSDISTTANLYGKFVQEHFKAGFEEAIKERKELVEWLEGGYFGK